jgi:WD40 repeat protein
MSTPNPFRGLKPYLQEDGHVFFGRDGDLTLVLDRLMSRRATLLFASSGAGKTSFLNARLMPELAPEFFCAYHGDWAVVDPLVSVRQSIRAAWVGSRWAPLAEPSMLTGRGEDALLSLYGVVEHPAAAAAAAAGGAETASVAGPRGCVLILDQFEEVFQNHGDDPAFAELVIAISKLINAPKPDVRVLFSMREEFLGELSVFDNRIPDLFNNYYRLKNPTRRQARDIIASTVRSYGVQPADTLPQLADDLVTATKVLRAGVEQSSAKGLRDSVPPPLLQIACRGLWDAHPPQPNGGPASFPAAYQPGDAVRQLEHYCDSMLARMSGAQQKTLSEALSFLITRKGAKVAYELSALSEHSGIGEARLRDVLDHLSGPDVRIFRKSVAPDGSTWFELYHDMYSPFLTRWNIDFRKRRRRVVRRAILTAALAVLAIFGGIAVVGYYTAMETVDLAVKGVTHAFAVAPIQEVALRADRHAARVTEVAYSPDGTMLASASTDATLKLWNTANRMTIRTLAAPQSKGFHTVAFSANGMEVAAAGNDSIIRVWSTRTGALTHQFKGHSDAVYSIAFSKGKIFSAGVDRRIRMWDVSTGAATVVDEHAAAVNAIALSPDGSKLVAGVFDGAVVLRDLTATASPATRIGKHPVSVLAVAWSPDGKHLASGSRDREIKIYNSEGRELFTLHGHSGAIRALSFSPDSKVLASAGADGTVRLWDTEKKGAAIATVVGHVGSVYAVAFRPDGQEVATAGQDKTIRTWSVETRRETAAFVGAWETPRAARFSGDGSRLVTVSPGVGVRVWNTQESAEPETYRGDYTAAAISPDGTRIAAGLRDGTVALLKGESLWKSPGPAPGPVRAIAFNSAGTFVGAAASNMVSVIDSGGGSAFQYRHSGPVEKVAVNNDGTLLACAGTTGVSAWGRDSQGGELQSAPVLDLAYSLFDHLLYAGSDGKMVRVEGSKKTAVALAGFAQQDNAVLAVNARGTSCAIGGRDGVVRYWMSWRSTPTEFRPGAAVLAAAFSPDSARLHVLTADGIARVYRTEEIAATVPQGAQ